jgi:uncharacterized protein YceH (UPF0502 family)
MSEVTTKRWALTPLEVRVLGVLVEKQHTVPDTYPLSLNALVAGCNQKTARLPVMEATEAEVLSAIDSLRALSLVLESSGARVARYEHNAGRVLHLPGQAVAPLAVLMLRGPQTSSELRVNTERPVTVTQGTNTIVGDDLRRALALVNDIVEGRYKKGGAIDGWDGRAAERIARILVESWA